MLLLLDYADNIYLPDKNIYTVNKITQAGLVNSEEVILAVNAEKTKYVYVYVCEQNAGQNNNTEIGNSPLKMWRSSSILERE
jgi:hypothetical protein